ncbi:MAG TPA: hypothetical protein VFX98_14375 [Longimicrobiaceae bacterium]|nr:hypothetical protein [Longimicrobiaceae bacterium]
MPQFTTLAIGEEETTTKPKSEEEVYTTLAVGEEQPLTTLALGEEDDDPFATAGSAFGEF